MCPLQNLAGVEVDDPVARCPPPRSAMPPSAASVTAQAPSSPRIATNNFAKTETRRRPASQHHTAGSRRSSSSIACYCRRSPSRARVRAAIKVNGASFLLMVQRKPGASEARRTMCPLQNLAGVDVDDPVARCPPPRSAMPPSAASVTAQAPSSPRIATNNFAKTETRRRPASQHHTAGSRRSSSSIPVIAAALPRARAKDSD